MNNKTLDITVDEIQYNEIKKQVTSVYESKTPLAFFRSYGCQQNVSDGEKICGMLEKIGFGFTNIVDDADLIFYNTCAVRENAEDRIFGNVGAVKQLKMDNPNLIIGLCGCMVQQPHITEKIKSSYPFVDIIFGTHALHLFPNLLHSHLKNHSKIIDINDSYGEIIEDIPTRREGGVRAWIPIMYGCNNFCSYCVVPLVRGRERSRKSADIILEASKVIDEGYKEIYLLGQNVNSYGNSSTDELSFSELLRAINDIPGEFIIRFMTSHPKDASEELIDTIAECDKIAKSIHLPVQSGSNKVLNEMNRKYTAQDYIQIVKYARKKIPEIGITSDIITGFPGETPEEANETLKLIKKIRFNSLFTFIYSPREGTAAKDLTDPYSYKEKVSWQREIIRVQREISSDINRSYIGKTQHILVDGVGSEEGWLTSRNSAGIIVMVKGAKSLVGKFLDVTITDSTNWSLTGDLINKGENI